MVEQRAGPYATDWGIELEAQHSAWEKGNRGTGSSVSAKRSAAGQADGLSVRGNKKAKTTDDAVMDDASMRKLFEKDGIKMVSLTLIFPNCYAKV